MARDVQARQQPARLRDLRAGFDAFSARELEVLGQVVRGKMNREIAADLNLNLRTVKLHRTNLTRTLKVQSVAELTRLVDAAGLFRTQRS